MYLYTSVHVMVDFICMGPVDLPGARRKRQNTKWKIPCPQWDSNPQPLDSKTDALPTELAEPGLVYAIHLNGLITYMYSQYQCLPCYKYQNNKVERNLSCKCTVLWYILEYMYILQIPKRRIGPVLAFNVQIPYQVECLAVFACWNSKQAHDLCVSLLFVQHLYIFQYVTQNSTFTRQNTLYHSCTYHNVYNGIGSTCM